MTELNYSTTTEKKPAISSYLGRRTFARYQGDYSHRVAVIVPCVVAHNLDAHTGIPFLPHIGAHMAGALDAAGYEVQVIDCFGLQPHQRRIEGEFMLNGVDEEWVAHHLKPETKVAFLYCRTVEDLISIERITQTLKRLRPEVKICLFENTQTVNSFSFKHIGEDLFRYGCDSVILGEPERRAKPMTEALLSSNMTESLSKILGVGYKSSEKVLFTENAPFDHDLDSLAYPLWEKFPMEGYWLAGYAHPPVKSNSKFLPILTSRGCPYRCTFCISPEVNPTWRGRSAQDVVDEMEYFYKKLGVTDFHVSDLDPTVNDKRTKDISLEIIQRKLPITWKIAQGTKIETIKSEETIELLAKSGVKFMAFSPESGSKKLLKIMNKNFNHEHALKMCKKMSEVGIRSQACFLVGIPGEDQEDYEITLEYIKKLLDNGLDEIAVYVFTPLPGAKLSEKVQGYTHYSQCTRSPTWRQDYKQIQKIRLRIYGTFFLHKLKNPLKILREGVRFITKQFETKMEMSVYKQLKLYMMYYLPFLFKKLNAEKRIQELNTVNLKQIGINS